MTLTKIMTWWWHLLSFWRNGLPSVIFRNALPLLKYDVDDDRRHHKNKNKAVITIKPSPLMTLPFGIHHVCIYQYKILKLLSKLNVRICNASRLTPYYRWKIEWMNEMWFIQWNSCSVNWGPVLSLDTEANTDWSNKDLVVWLCFFND